MPNVHINPFITWVGLASLSARTRDFVQTYISFDGFAVNNRRM